MLRNAGRDNLKKDLNIPGMRRKKNFISWVCKIILMIKVIIEVRKSLAHGFMVIGEDVVAQLIKRSIICANL